MEEKISYHESGKDSLYKIWHASEQSLFIYMNSDGGSIVCGEKSYPIKKGALCFIGAGKYHYTMPDIPASYDRSKLFVCEDDLKKIRKNLSIVDNKFVPGSFVYALVDEKEIEKVDEVFRKLEENHGKETYKKWMIISCIIELLAYLDKYTLENIPTLSGVMSRAIEYINRNIKKDINIDEICSEIHMSKYHFCRQFKKTTGITVMKYILNTRLVIAKSMLISEKIPITEISNRCGFSSVSYFSRVFKEETGLAPLSYRKQYCLCGAP